MLCPGMPTAPLNALSAGTVGPVPRSRAACHTRPVHDANDGLAELLAAAARGSPPPADGGLTVLAQPSPRDAGVVAFTAHNVGEMVIQLMVVAPQLPSHVAPHRMIPRSLDDLVMRCLAKQPRGRPSSMAMVRRRLLAVADAMNAPTRVMDAEEIDAIIQRARKVHSRATVTRRNRRFTRNLELRS